MPDHGPIVQPPDGGSHADDDPLPHGGDTSTRPSADGAGPGSSAAAGPISPTSAPIPVPPAAKEVAPPDPLDPQTLGTLLQRASPSVADTRFSMADLIRNPDLQRAARRELEGSKAPSSLTDSDPGSLAALDGNGHEPEVERQRALLRELDRRAAEEAALNAELVKLTLERLAAGKQALEGLVQLLTSLGQLEQQRAAGLAAAAKLPLTGPADGATLMACAAMAQALPARLGAVHEALHQQAQQLLDPLQELQGRYAVASRDLKAQAQAAARAVDGCRRQLGHVFQQHAAACLAFDQAAEGGRAGSRSLLLGRIDNGDPWDGEARLVSEQRTLVARQDEERQFALDALSAVTQLEEDRVMNVTAVTQQLLRAYADTLGGLPQQVAALLPSEEQAATVAAQAPAHVADLQRLAAGAASAAQQLSSRRRGALEDVVQELFCSPEITRQGEVEVWDPRGSAWQRRHAVLTRAGYLHCFERMSDDARCEVMRLARCEVEQGEARVINLTEASIGSWLVRGSKRCVLKAGSVEEYCEWALALREAIAACAGKR